MAKLPNYKGTVGITSGIVPKGGQTFPLMEAHDILVDETGKRLDEKLEELGNGGNDNTITADERSILNLLKAYINEEYDEVEGTYKYSLGMVPSARYAPVYTHFIQMTGSYTQEIGEYLLVTEFFIVLNFCSGRSISYRTLDDFMLGICYEEGLHFAISGTVTVAEQHEGGSSGSTPTWTTHVYNAISLDTYDGDATIQYYKSGEDYARTPVGIRKFDNVAFTCKTALLY